MDKNDKRHAKRINYICEIQCEGNGIGRISTRINDISVSGLFIDALAHLPVGSILKLRFTLRGTLIDVMGEVRYCMPKVGMGVQFLTLEPEHQMVIERLVEGKPLDTQPLVLPAARPSVAVNGSEPPAEGDAILMGSFAVINLFDVVQMIEISKVTGTLTVSAPVAAGEIYFNDGMIANARTGSCFGLNAVNQFLDLQEGAFEFRRSERGYARSIPATSNAGLLSDLLAARNEKPAYT